MKALPATTEGCKDFPNKIDENDFCKKVFESFGFQWGGHWRSVKDYQHFEKRK